MVLLALSPMGSIYAQETSTTIPRVSAGQRVPEEFWTKEFQFYDHEKAYTQTLEEYRGKPLILAFWSNTCSVCINTFPFLNQMKSKYAEALYVVLVNPYQRDSIAAIDLRFSRLDSGYQMPSIIGDDYLKQLFPHGPVPHYIWLNGQGRVSAVTTRILLDEDNILKMLKFYENR